MKKLLAFLKTARWVVVLVIAVVVGVLFLVLRHLFQGDKPNKPGALPDIPTALQQEVEQAEENAMKARIEAQIKADAQKQQLDQICQIEDGAARRQALAAMLQNL